MRSIMTLSLAAVLALAGCGTMPNTAAGGSADSDLAQDIKAKLTSDSAIQPANLDVAANAARNEATLSGTLPSEDLRTKAIELAKSAQPNLVVTDRIEVRPTEVSRGDYNEDHARETREAAKRVGNQVGRSVDDAWIYTKIMARLAADPDTSALKVNVDVTDKVVTLRGHVATPIAKTEAERLARDTDGVASVRDLLSVETAG